MSGTGDGVGITQRVADVTLAKWDKHTTEATRRRLPLLAILQKKGNVKYGVTGGAFRWPWRYREHGLAGHVDGAAKDFERNRLRKVSSLEWRGYDSNDAITLLEKIQQGGPEAVIKIFSSLEGDMKKGLIRQLGKEWFKDGELAANVTARTFHGIETFCASPGAQTATAELASSLTVSYAGHSTSYTGHDSAAVAGDAGYGVYSPVIANCNRQDASANTLAWADYADQYIRLLVNEACYGNGAEDMLDLILLRKSSYRDLLNIAETKERLPFVRGEGLELVKMGFRNTVEIDGVSVTWDVGIPATDGASKTIHGYGFNCDEMELLLGGKAKTIFKTKMTFNADHQADRLYAWCLGNLVFNSPKFHGKLVELV